MAQKRDWKLAAYKPETLWLERAAGSLWLGNSIIRVSYEGWPKGAHSCDAKPSLRLVQTAKDWRFRQKKEEEEEKKKKKTEEKVERGREGFRVLATAATISSSFTTTSNRVP
jgi:hypothetical protein